METSNDNAARTSRDLDEFSPPSEIPADRIVILATIVEVNQTACWHANLGWALFLAGCYDEAEKYLLRAIAMDDTAWWPRYGMAHIFEDRKLYSQAADWGLKTMSSLSDTIRESQDTEFLRYQITQWLMDSGDAERAIQFTYKTYCSRPKDVKAIDLYIETLHACGRTEQTFFLFKSLSGMKGTGGEGTLLTDLFLNGAKFEAVLPFAIRSSECGQEIKNACNALQVGNQVSSLKLDRIATLKYRYFERTEEAIEAWTTVLMKAENPYERSNALIHLPQIFFDLAAAIRKEGGDYQSWVLKLQDLSNSWGKHGSDREASYSTLLLGHWFRQFEQVEEKVWRPYFKARVLETLEMLDDNDPYNDQRAYYNLARILFLAGDRENASAAYAVFLKPLEALATERVEAAQTGMKVTVKNYVFWPDRFSCSGVCDIAEDIFKKLYTCETCFEVQFCAACMKLVKVNELPFRVCNPQHAFSQVYPLPKERQDFAARLINGRVEVQKEWVEKLKKQWKRW